DSTAPISLAKLKRMNYFERLNVNPYASTEKIKESYYKQIKRFNNEVFAITGVNINEPKMAIIQPSVG
ncbi:hypothetical protein ACW7EJ_18455, partial [Acinetobacter soli]